MRASITAPSLVAVDAAEESSFALIAVVVKYLVMSTITIAVPDPLDAALTERMNALGARSKEEYVLALVESDCAASELEQTLGERLTGPFAPLAGDWKQGVRQAAAQRA